METEMQAHDDDVSKFVNAYLEQPDLDQPITVTVFPNMWGRSKKEERLSLRQLKGKIERAKGKSKDELPWLKLASFGDRRSERKCLRNDKNVIAISGVLVDYDNGPLTPEVARDRMEKAGIGGVVYTTPSHHQPGKGNRWRAAALCSSELPPEQHEALVARLNGIYDGGLDDASFTLSQSYYYGNVTGQTPVEVHLVEGSRFIDQADDLDATAIGKRGRTRDNDNGAGTSFNEAGLIKDLLSGANYHGSAISLLGHWAAIGESYIECRQRIGDLFQSIPEVDRRPAWAARVAEIPALLNHIFGNRARHETEEEDRLTSLFRDYPELEAEEEAAVEEAEKPTTAKAATAFALTFLTPGQCTNAPRRDYVVKGMVAPGDVSCVFGIPGAGKSVLAPHMAYMVAQGSPFFGLRTKTGKVFYVTTEDDTGMMARVAALHEQHGDAPNFAMIPGITNLAKKSPAFKALLAAIDDQRPSLVIIDTMAMAFPGLEENEAKAMGRVVDVAKHLASFGAAVVLVHHSTKEDTPTPRGHSVLNGALYMGLHLTRDEASGVVRAKMTKNKNGSCDRDIAFKISTRCLGKDDDGDDIRAPIVEEYTAKDVPKPKPLAPAEKAALAILIELAGEEKRPVSEADWRKACENGRAVCASPKSKSRWEAASRAVKGLVGKNRVVFRDGFYSQPVAYSPIPADFMEHGDEHFDDVDDE